MNLDIFSQFIFKDTDGLRQFFLAHRVAHTQIEAAIAQTHGTTLTTFNISNSAAENAWAQVMQNEDKDNPPELSDWLNWHADVHNYENLVVAPAYALVDLSQVHFGDVSQFYDWMLVHQQVHSVVAQTLGLV